MISLGNVTTVNDRQWTVVYGPLTQFKRLAVDCGPSTVDFLHNSLKRPQKIP